MNMQQTCYRAFLLILVSPSLLMAQIIVEDTNISLLENSQIPPYMQVEVAQTPDATCETNIWFSVAMGPSVEMASLTFETINLDEGSDWYLASEHDVFSSQSIANGTHTLWGGFTPDGEEVVVGNTIDVPIGGSFFLGVTTTGFGFSGLGSNRNTFGWTEFSIDSSLNVTLLDNALAYGTDRIIIGRNSIPEPSTISFIAVAVVLCSLKRRHRCERSGPASQQDGFEAG